MNYVKDKLKVFLEKIRKNKRLLYLSLVSVLALFCLVLNVTFSFLSSNFSSGGANVIVGDLKYRMVINEVELDESVGTKIPSNTIVGDRIILTKSGKTEQFNIILNSLNDIDTKYEIVYKVCADVNCTSFIDTPDDVQVAYHIDTPYVSGELKANKSKYIYLVTDNQTSNDYYIQVGLNVGYSHNTLALTNQITNDFSPLGLEGFISIIGYVNGVEVDAFPTEPNYETGITCSYKDGTVSNARGVFTYSASKGWEVDVFGLNRSLTTCRVDFTEVLKVTYEVLSNRYDCANLAAGSKPSNPVISYSGNCSVIQDTANTDGTHTWRMKLLSSGNLSVNGMIYIDAFLVGGGGGGGNGSGDYNRDQNHYGGSGGGGGYTLTQKNIRLDNKNGTYQIVIGAGGTATVAGGTTAAFGYNIGGGGAGGSYSGTGGVGGSGGGGWSHNNSTGSIGGSYGNAGGDGSGWYTRKGGAGQGTTTCEFGEGTLSGCTRGDEFAYAGGGGGGCNGGAGGAGGGGHGDGYAATPNTGGGGGGSRCAEGNIGGAGGSGVVVIRDVRL